jgi:hypothetical protein
MPGLLMDGFRQGPIDVGTRREVVGRVEVSLKVNLPV